MRRRGFTLRVILLGALQCAASGRSSAAGFHLYEMGTRATALGGAFVATADDASAIFYNPAALAWQEGTEVALTVSPLRPTADYERDVSSAADYPGLATGSTKTETFFPTGLYASARLHDRIAAGIGFFTPFGLGVDWEDAGEFAGRPISTNAQLRTYYVSPVVAYQMTSCVSIGVGAHFVWSDVQLENITTQATGVGNQVVNVIDTTIEGSSDMGVGVALGLFVQATPKLALGLNFKQGVSSSISDGSATFSQRLTGIQAIDDAVAAQLDAIGGEGTQGASSELDFPDMFVVGGRYDFGRGLSVMADYVWFDWSVFDSIELEFEDAPARTLQEGYEDSWQLRGGVEYGFSEGWSAMLGYVRDKTPQPLSSMGPRLPDASRNDYSGGLSWTTRGGSTQLSLAYMYVRFDDRTTVEGGNPKNRDGFDASYISRAHILSLGLTQRF